MAETGADEGIDLNTREGQVKAIQNMFQKAKRPDSEIRHPTKKKLRVKRSLPLLPDFQVRTGMPTT